MLRTRKTALLFSEITFKVAFFAIPPLLQRLPPLHITVILILSEISIVGAVRHDIAISFSSQNVNSLNLTGSKANFDVKISTIKYLNTDVNVSKSDILSLCFRRSCLALKINGFL